MIHTVYQAPINGVENELAENGGFLASNIFYLFSGKTFLIQNANQMFKRLDLDHEITQILLAKDKLFVFTVEMVCLF